jgi:NAD(P)-dependent dehydrogenase (short-subunit alcohol dehydrogenase family)
MGALAGRVAIITGAGRGLGREHALLFGREGASVVVNDLGGAVDGSGSDRTAAQEVVDEIVAAGGEAIANGDNVADWDGAKRLIESAVEAFGRLDVLVNNAGILRDRSIPNMSEQEWDAVINVHLKGHFAPTHFAAAYWKQRAADGDPAQGAIVNTSSAAGLCGNFGQANYAAAKAGIAAMTLVQAMELGRFGVRANCVAPLARTRLTLQTPGLDAIVGPPEGEDAFDAWHPGNVSPLVAYLATADCPVTGGVFHVGGSEIGLAQGWTVGEILRADGRWQVEDIGTQLKAVLEGRPALASWGSTIEGLTGEFVRNASRTS